jgi:hypothetical protein
MLAARIMQHSSGTGEPQRADPPGLKLAQARPRATQPAGDVLRQNTMIFTIICVVGLVVSFVATAHAIWVRGI